MKRTFMVVNEGLRERVRTQYIDKIVAHGIPHSEFLGRRPSEDERRSELPFFEFREKKRGIIFKYAVIPLNSYPECNNHRRGIVLHSSRGVPFCWIK